MKVRALVVFALALATSIPLIAQTCSPNSYSNTLICTLPQLFGPSGLTLPNPKHDAHFAGNSQAQFRPLNQAIGQTLSILPLGSSGSGTTFTLDSEGHPVPTEDSLGPILTERANVIGRKAINLGVAYQYFSFDKIDGINLHNFPAVLLHLDWTPDLAVSPGVFKQDYIETLNDVHVDLNQTVIYLVYGIAKRMDASIEVPIQSANLRVSSTANIIRTQPCEFDSTCPSGTDDVAECGQFHYFEGYQDTGADCQKIAQSVTQTFPTPGISFKITDVNGKIVNVPPREGSLMTGATGIGDIILRGKYEVIRGEKLVGSVGLGVRFPSGDAKNFLGTGAYGVIPFGQLTYRARLSPHVRFGYEWNGDSVLAGDPTTTTGSSASLPPGWLYSAGADYRATKRLTIAADLIGETVLSASRLSLGFYNLLPATNGNTPTETDKKPVKSILPTTASYNSDAIAVGAKVRLKRELVLIGNATVRVNDGGLRANVVPLVGLSYAFF